MIIRRRGATTKLMFFAFLGFCLILYKLTNLTPEESLAERNPVAGKDWKRNEIHVDDLKKRAGPLAPPDENIIKMEAHNQDDENKIKPVVEVAVVKPKGNINQKQDEGKDDNEVEDEQADEEHEEAKEEEHPMQINMPMDKDKPGENGKPIIIDKAKLSPEERKKFDLGYKNNAFNEYASDLMSLHRQLPDDRDDLCKTMKYRPVDQLPSVSVIIIFHNEAWSVLLRTVHSVIDRSPPEILKEVILVDDNSTFSHLHRQLDDYVNNMEKVQVVRLPSREGLIRARLLGYSVATGDVLVFLDSHCEAAPGWLEPLADRIADDWTNVLTPIIESINDDDLSYRTAKAKNVQVGGFNWQLVFTWHTPPEEDLKNRTSPVAPIRSPTMAGGLFAISRKYFEYLGTYDPGMDIWGGENLEISFRIWMCGGNLETVPCSHVGHIFRKHSPYKWRTGVDVVTKNNLRLSEVWMDQYKSYYQERLGNRRFQTNYGDVSARKELREKLHCRSFSWFLKNIYPSLFVPGNSIAKGEIRNKVKGMCVDSPVGEKQQEKAVKLYPCHGGGGNQLWLLTRDGEIRRDETCIDFTGTKIIVFTCHGSKGNQNFEYNESGQIKSVSHRQCMEMSENGSELLMRPCNVMSERQVWLWERRVPDDERV